MLRKIILLLLCTVSLALEPYESYITFDNMTDQKVSFSYGSVGAGDLKGNYLDPKDSFTLVFKNKNFHFYILG